MNIGGAQALRTTSLKSIRARVLTSRRLFANLIQQIGLLKRVNVRGAVATIGDVARKAGVSRTSVSFAFNDPSRISKETHQRILAIADELGYYPNPVARSLISKRVGVLGLL